jgi:pSer/pThr/pTyr-binding forkhead associated (FHA) protein
LVFQGGASSGRALPLGAAPLVIGASTVPDDPAISTRHCQVRLDGDRCLLEDLGSTNGTFLNERRIDAPTYVLDGDVVRIGNTELKLRMR